MNLKFSIIITNFNYSSFVGSAIESVISQDYDNVECIVVDDGSLDDSRSVIDRYDSVIKVFKENGGLSDAATAGFNASSGDIIIFLDADDVLDKQLCSVIRGRFTDTATVYSYKLRKIDRNGNKLGSYPNELPVLARQSDFVDRYGYLPVAPTSGSAYPRHHCQYMFERMPLGQKRYGFDGYLSFSAPYRGDVVYIDQFLGDYLVHGSNMSSRSRSEKALHHNVMNALYQCAGILIAKGQFNFSHSDSFDYISPYHLKNYLILLILYNVNIVPDISKFRIVMRSIRKFLLYPNIKIRKRFINIIIVIVLIVFPASVSRRIFL